MVPAMEATPKIEEKPEPKPEEKPKKKKRPSRADVWMDACQQIMNGLETLQDLKSQFEEWKDNMPDSLQSGETYQKLEAICDLDLDSIDSIVGEADGLDLPLGFGRD